MVIYKEQIVQRPLNFAIIDEVDSILIDEARTPLIILVELRILVIYINKQVCLRKDCNQKIMKLILNQDM